MLGNSKKNNDTDIFDIGTRVNSNHVTMLDSQVVANDTVDTGAAIVELVVSKDNQDGVLSLLSSHEDSITTEELERVHRCLGEGDNAVVIIDGISDPSGVVSICLFRSFQLKIPTSTGSASSSSSELRLRRHLPAKVSAIRLNQKRPIIEGGLTFLISAPEGSLHMG